MARRRGCQTRRARRRTAFGIVPCLYAAKTDRAGDSVTVAFALEVPAELPGWACLSLLVGGRHDSGFQEGVTIADDNGSENQIVDDLY